MLTNLDVLVQLVKSSMLSLNDLLVLLQCINIGKACNSVFIDIGFIFQSRMYKDGQYKLIYICQ